MGEIDFFLPRGGRSWCFCASASMETHCASGSGTNVAEMQGRLNLTTEKNDALAVDDDSVEGLATSDLAVIGKVLSPNALHI